MGQVATTLVLQGAIQALSLGAGLVLIRLLPVTEYAYYTIVAASLGSLSVMSDAGIVQGLLSQGGRIWHNRDALGSVYASSAVLRRLFSLAALAIILPLTIWLLHRQGVGAVISAVTALSLVPAFLAAASGQLLEVVLKLHGRQLSLQIAQGFAALVRLTGTAVVALMVPWAASAMLLTGVVQMVLMVWLRRLASPLARLDAPPDPAARAAIGAQVRRMAPGAIYYAISGQVSVWLIAVMGSTTSVAQVGALGRLTMIFNVLGTSFSMLALPLFARLDAKPARMQRKFLGLQFMLLVACAPVCLLSWLWPEGFLLLLGPDYGALQTEVLLALLGASLGVLASASYSLSAARGVVMSPWLSLPLTVGLQAACVVLLPIGQTSGVLWMAIIVNLIFWALHGAYFLSRNRDAVREV